MTLYIGLDLAWSARNRSGAATLHGGSDAASLREAPTLLGDDTAVLGYVLRNAADADSVIVAIDAPLWVPNQTGRRLAEATISAAFHSYEAGSHPANRSLLARDGIVRGEVLVDSLEQHGFRHVDRIDADMSGRLITEVYTHPAMVAIFGLERTLKYKARPGRSSETRLAAWQLYQDHLRALEQADPPMHGHSQLLAVAPATLRPARLKDYEDQVDALFCAYIALYAHHWGAARCRTFGTMREGYVFTPVPEAMWDTPQAPL